MEKQFVIFDPTVLGDASGIPATTEQYQACVNQLFKDGFFGDGQNTCPVIQSRWHLDDDGEHDYLYLDYGHFSQSAEFARSN